MQRNALVQGAHKVHVVDEAIRKHMKGVDPKRNVWQILDTYSGGGREQIENALGDKFEDVQKLWVNKGIRR